MIHEQEGADLMSGINHQKLQLVNMSTRNQRGVNPHPHPTKSVLKIMLSKSKSGPNNWFIFLLESIRGKKQNSWWEQSGYVKGKSTTKLVHLYFAFFSSVSNSCNFARAALKKYHKQSGLNKQKLIVSLFWSLKLQGVSGFRSSEGHEINLSHASPIVSGSLLATFCLLGASPDLRLCIHMAFSYYIRLSPNFPIS